MQRPQHEAEVPVVHSTASGKPVTAAEAPLATPAAAHAGAASQPEGAGPASGIKHALTGLVEKIGLKVSKEEKKQRERERKRKRREKTKRRETKATTKDNKKNSKKNSTLSKILLFPFSLSPQSHPEEASHFDEASALAHQAARPASLASKAGDGILAGDRNQSPAGMTSMARTPGQISSGAWLAGRSNWGRWSAGTNRN